MKTFLINFYVKHRADTGYAIINAPNITIAQKILETQGKEACHGYKVLSSKQIDLPCAPLTIVHEGVTTTGLSAYQIAVKYGYKGTEEQWIASLQRGTDTEQLQYYNPAEGIPSTILSEEHGALPPSTKDQLSGYTFSELFDRILFKEQQPSVLYNSSNNTITPVYPNVEVGQSIQPSSFKTNCAVATYQYPTGNILWTRGNITIINPKAILGDNQVSCTFTLTVPEGLQLKTSYGNTPQQTVSVTGQTYTAKCSVKGFYNIGWKGANSQPTSYSTLKVTSKPISYIIDSTAQTSYVYVALPTVWTLVKTAVQDPLNDNVYMEINNFTKVASNQQITSLSDSIRYNIWAVGKANSNSDGTITANSKKIKITVT